MWRTYRIRVLKVWFTALLFLAACVGVLSTISYFSDKAEKNIPVGMKYLMIGAISGFPGGNETSTWRQQFKEPNYAVWPYYMLFGIFVASVVILMSFTFVGCSFDEKDRLRRSHCACCNDCWCYTGPFPVCDCCNCQTSTNCIGCSGTAQSVKCDGNGGEVMAILVLVVAVIIILSAVFVVILFCVQRCSLLYDRLTDMIRNQQYELEEETVVLGLFESWHPNDAV
jgi:hypothetical protein